MCYVGAFDKDLNLKHYKSDKLSYSAGRFKSQYLLEMGKAEKMAMSTYSQEVFQLKLKTLLKKQELCVSKTELPNLIVLTSLILM